MRKPSKHYDPPRMDTPGWAVIYGQYGIVIGYADTEKQAQRAADLLNKQAPQYNHRVKELSSGEQAKALRGVR